MKFTDKQLADFAAYLAIQKSGAFSMFAPEARAATGLEKDDYIFVMENYAELKEATELAEQSAKYGMSEPTPEQGKCDHHKWRVMACCPMHCPECGLQMWDAGN